MKYIIDFKNELTLEEINQYISNINGTVIKNYSISEKTYLIDAQQEIVYNDSIHDLVLNDDNTNIEPLSTIIESNQQYGLTTLNGPTVTISTQDSDIKDWWKNYVVLRPNFDQPSYTIDRRGTGYTVYVLDSGCDITHQEFVGRPVTNLFSFNNDVIDYNGHGTAITSVITGIQCGISEATVKAVKIFDKNQPTKLSDLVNSLDAIYQDFMQNQMTFAIINCSWSIDKNLFIESKLQVLIDIGMVVIASAGNNGSSIENVTPASMDSVITIGSFNQNLVPSDFSNYTGESIISFTNNETNNGALDGWAPGEIIYAAGLNNSYGYVVGTSIAAGIHSAVCAYNLSLGDMEFRANASVLEFIKNSSLGRSDLLDLSNPKYQSSVNKISTLINHIEMTNPIKFSPFVKAFSGTQYYVRLFSPQKTKTLEILGNLPPGIKINENGQLVGLAPMVNSATKEIIPMRLVDTDDQEILFDLTIITLPPDFIIGQDTTDDPILNIQLNVPNCYPSNPCEPAPPAEPGCNDNCPSPFSCVSMFDKACASAARCECTV